MVLVLMMLGLGGFCILIYNCAVYIVPFAIGVWVGFAVLHLGGGPVGGILIGLFAGGAAFGLCQTILGVTHSNVVRALVMFVFVAPAILAGYSAGLQLSALTITSSVWQHLYAIIAAGCVGCTAFLRLMTPPNSTGTHARV